MEYPKAIMSISELTKLGFSDSYLREAVREKDQRFATRTSPKGKYMIDTEKFEQHRINQEIRRKRQNNRSFQYGNS